LVEIPVSNPTIENKNIMINKQELIDEVYIGNVVSIVRNGKVAMSIMNISEVTKHISKKDVSRITYDEDVEYKIHTVKSESNNDERINEILDAIRCDHMNEEEKQSILGICKQYSEIFLLEGDKLTCTNAITHEIKIKTDQPPIYKRPYRLPQAQQAEIERQINQMESDDIIEPSMSPWNAPLLLVKKKPDASGREKFRIVVDYSLKIIQ
jgi:hypothetical protein